MSLVEGVTVMERVDAVGRECHRGGRAGRVGGAEEGAGEKAYGFREVQELAGEREMGGNFR